MGNILIAEESLTETDFENARRICAVVKWTMQLGNVPPDPTIAQQLYNIVMRVESAEQVIVTSSEEEKALLERLKAEIYKGLEMEEPEYKPFGQSKIVWPDIVKKVLTDEEILFEYCGIFWNWWITRNMIALKFGAEFDMDRMAILYGMATYAPILFSTTVDGNEVMGVSKPSTLRYVQDGVTAKPFCFPLYELHADGEPAVECAGVELYYQNNTLLPKKYGSVHSSKWESAWILEEENVELRRLLIEKIGFEKVCKDLNAKAISTWHNEKGGEYVLFKLKMSSGEDIHMLRMKCPSTGREYFEGIAPSITSAEDAYYKRLSHEVPTFVEVREVNWVWHA